MIGVTVGVGQRFYPLAVNAAASVGRYARIATAVLSREIGSIPDYTGDRRSLPLYLRLHIFDWLDGDVFYFDADTLMLRDWNVGQYAGRSELVVVRDVQSPAICADAARIGIPPEEYFNSGMMIMNAKYHACLLAKAREIALSRAVKGMGFHDQTCLNAARRDLGIPLLFLDVRYNYAVCGRPLPWPWDTVLLHATGPNKGILSSPSRCGYQGDRAHTSLKGTVVRTRTGRLIVYPRPEP